MWHPEGNHSQARLLSPFGHFLSWNVALCFSVLKIKFPGKENCRHHLLWFWALGACSSRRPFLQGSSCLRTENCSFFFPHFFFSCFLWSCFARCEFWRQDLESESHCIIGKQRQELGPPRAPSAGHSHYQAWHRAVQNCAGDRHWRPRVPELQLRAISQSSKRQEHLTHWEVKLDLIFCLFLHVLLILFSYELSGFGKRNVLEDSLPRTCHWAQISNSCITIKKSERS